MIALVFLVFHLRYLPKSLEDLDSINFALGVRHFDVAQHQPHPPGYPLYILLGKAVHMVVPSEVSALALLSIGAGALGAIAIVALVRRFDEDDTTRWAQAAAIIAVTSPLYWFTAGRPLSDAPGLAAAVAVQAATLAATTRRRLCAASFCAALATGIRSQVAWLTVPLLITQAFALGGLIPGAARGTAVGVREGLRDVWLALIGLIAAFAAGALVWAIPLLILSGGPAAYWKALAFQGSADIGNIQMLWTRHRPRDVADALYYAFVAPWATWTVAAVVLLFAAIGAIALLITRRRAPVLLAAAFGPYFFFDVLFQETFTSRYALPLVIPVAYLAIAGMRLLPWRSGAVVVAVIAMFGAYAGGTSLAGYSREPAPAFRLLDDMRSAARVSREPPVLAMDRKQSFDFRRPVVWVDGALPAFAGTLPVPPQHEWLEAVTYWTGGGRAPVWFVVDPKRTMIDLVQHGEPTAYRWSLLYPVLIGGARPDEMDFVRVEEPEWFVGEGWALTPEAAGIAEADHRGPSIGPIEGWISPKVFGGAIVMGGRNFSSAPASISFDVGNGRLNRLLPGVTVPSGAFVRVVQLPTLEPPLGPEYVRLLVRALPDARVAIEQFDVSGRRPVFGYGDGWHEQEFDPRTGLRWRWLSERGELHYWGDPVVLHLEGESPQTYFSRDSRLVVRVGSSVLFDGTLSSDFSLNIAVPGTDRRISQMRIHPFTWEREPEVITLETDQVFQPADRSRRSADRRHLGLRVFKCELHPVS